MTRALVATIFTIDVDRGEEVIDLVRNLGIALSVRNINSLVKVEEIDIPDSPEKEASQAVN
jgi:hypothetical protein